MRPNCWDPEQGNKLINSREKKKKVCEDPTKKKHEGKH